MALSGALSGGREAGAVQQPRRAQHKALCDGQEELAILQYPGRAQSSAVIYSLIETAKENDLDPYRYLVWLLHNAPEQSQKDEDWPEFFLPVNAPKECRS